MPGSEIEALKSLAASYQAWADGATFVVFLGLLGEIVIVFMFTEDKPRREIVLSAMCAVVIAFGVFGEWIFGSRAARENAHLQNISDQKVAELNKQAEQARLDAKQAKAQSDSFQRDIADSNVRAKSAEAKVASADAASRAAVAQVANAQARIAEAQRAASEAQKEAARLNREAEGERLARIKIEEKLAPRTLSTEQQQRIEAKLKAFSGTPYELAVDPVPEAISLLTTVDAILRSSGWEYKGSSNRQFRSVFLLPNGSKAEEVYSSGVWIKLTQTLLAKHGPAAEALGGALQAEGIATSGQILPESDPSPNTIHVIIGSKE